MSAKASEPTHGRSSINGNAEQFRKIMFNPGALGLSLNEDDGKVTDVHTTGQASEKGVQVGWHVAAINGTPFTEDILCDAINGSVAYCITFNTNMNHGKAAAAYEAKEAAIRSAREAKEAADHRAYGETASARKAEEEALAAREAKVAADRRAQQEAALARKAEEEAAAARKAKEAADRRAQEEAAAAREAKETAVRAALKAKEAEQRAEAEAAAARKAREEALAAREAKEAADFRAQEEAAAAREAQEEAAAARKAKEAADRKAQEEAAAAREAREAADRAAREAKEAELRPALPALQLIKTEQAEKKTRSVELDPPSPTRFEPISSPQPKSTSVVERSMFEPISTASQSPMPSGFKLQPPTVFDWRNQVPPPRTISPRPTVVTQRVVAPASDPTTPPRTMPLQKSMHLLTPSPTSPPSRQNSAAFPVPSREPTMDKMAQPVQTTLSGPPSVQNGYWQWVPQTQTFSASMQSLHGVRPNTMGFISPAVTPGGSQQGSVRMPVGNAGQRARSGSPAQGPAQVIYR